MDKLLEEQEKQFGVFGLFDEIRKMQTEILNKIEHAAQIAYSKGYRDGAKSVIDTNRRINENSHR